MTGFEQVVVGIGTPDGDAELIAYAAMLARLGGSREVHFAHVAAPTAPAAAIRSRMRAQVDPRFEGTGVATSCDVLHGSLTDRLLAYVTERQADLVIIGAKKHKLGARLAMVAPCSVAVVPNHAPATLSHLLVAFDFSDAAARTLGWATGLVAADPTIRCTALHVMTHESTELFADQEDEAEQAETMRAILADSNRHGVTVEPRLAAVCRRTRDDGDHDAFALPSAVQAIDVAQTILAEAKKYGADCLALSTRGRSRSAAILLGSVTEEVIERSPIPLLVGKQSGENLGLASILLGRAGRQSGLKTN